MAKYYLTCSGVENLLNKYTEQNGDIYEIEPGVLGYGFLILTGPGLYSFVIRETCISEWSSTHEVHKYKTLPAKYIKLINA